MEIHNLLDAKSRAELREWLLQNHKTEKECWVADLQMTILSGILML